VLKQFFSLAAFAGKILFLPLENKIHISLRAAVLYPLCIPETTSLAISFDSEKYIPSAFKAL